MTTVLSELRKLDDARRNGALSDAEHARLRDHTLNAVEDAEVVSEPIAKASTPGAIDIWHVVVFLLVVD